MRFLLAHFGVHLGRQSCAESVETHFGSAESLVGFVALSLMALPGYPLASSHSLGSRQLCDLSGSLRDEPGVGLGGGEFFELDRLVGCPHSSSIHQYPLSGSPCPSNEHLLLLVGHEHLGALHLVLSD